MCDSPDPNSLPDVPRKAAGVRWGAWAALVAMLVLYWVTARPRISAVPWTSDLKAAVALASEKKQPILLEFHTSWCGACDWMNREVFPRADVAKALAGWVPVQIDGDANPELVQRFAVEAYPTFVVITPTGQVARRFEGSMPPDEFIAFLHASATGSSQPSTQSTEQRSN